MFILLGILLHDPLRDDRLQPQSVRWVKYGSLRYAANSSAASDLIAIFCNCCNTSLGKSFLQKYHRVTIDDEVKFGFVHCIINAHIKFQDVYQCLKKTGRL